MTGAKSEGFELQLQSLETLIEAGVSCHPSIMASFSPRRNLDALIMRLESINWQVAKETEIEELIPYPHVVNRIQKHGLKHYSAIAHERFLSFSF